MSESLVLREDRGPVALLTLNRPDRRNALSAALLAELGDALSRLEVDTAIRSVVLTGAGTVFCAGMDLREAEASGRREDAESSAIADIRALADLIDQIHGLPRPVIAALNGDALAGGAGIALACDFVVADEGVRLGYPEVLRGLVPATVMHDLIHQAGERRARELLLTGRPIDANVAEAWGLFNRVVPKGSAVVDALALAASLSAGGPLAIAGTKRQINDASGRPRDLRGAAAISAAVRVSEEAAEGHRSFLERRPARWAGPTT